MFLDNAGVPPEIAAKRDEQRYALLGESSELSDRKLSKKEASGFHYPPIAQERVPSDRVDLESEPSERSGFVGLSMYPSNRPAHERWNVGGGASSSSAAARSNETTVTVATLGGGKKKQPEIVSAKYKGGKLHSAEQYRDGRLVTEEDEKKKKKKGLRKLMGGKKKKKGTVQVTVDGEELINTGNGPGKPTVTKQPPL